ncbi:MAG: IS30 family transposase, partial [Romboutsia sp.]|nr:IS30 family transposase [Romboutsia sp.]
STITQNELDVVVNIINNRPRKCLGYKTPAEVFDAT